VNFTPFLQLEYNTQHLLWEQKVFQTNPLSITASVQHIKTVLRHAELT